MFQDAVASRTQDIADSQPSQPALNNLLPNTIERTELTLRGILL